MAEHKASEWRMQQGAENAEREKEQQKKPEDVGDGGHPKSDCARCVRSVDSFEK